MEELAIKIEHVTKQYRLGAIGGGTLKGDLQSWMARKRGQEDPNSKIGSKQPTKIGERFLALDDINFEVKKGEAVGIIGHNGAGKSTLLKLLSRVTAPTSGKISIDGRIASMLEVGTGFHPELTGRENVYMNGAILGMTRAEIDKKFDEIVEFSEVAKFIDTPVKRYSSGMYVKLAFSVAAHLDSEIMIMDEVLAVGDMAFQKKCLTKMREAAKVEGRTVLYVSHNMNTIRQLCDRCIVMDHGHVIYDGEVEEAIDIYLNNSAGENEVDMDLDAKPHFGNECTYDIWMKHIRIEQKDTPIFFSKEKLILSIVINAKKELHDVRFRMTLRNENDIAVGTAWSNSLSLEQGDQVVKIVMDLSSIEKGILYPCFGFYQTNAAGTFRMLDHINRAFRIEIVQDPEAGKMIWSPSFWGCIKLPEMTMESVK